MLTNFGEFQKLAQEGLEVAAQSFTAASKGAQAAAAQTAEYLRASFEHGTATAEKLVGARSLDRAIEVQSDYAKSAYEGFVAQATKLGEIYADAAKQSYKSLEGYAAKIVPGA